MTTDLTTLRKPEDKKSKQNPLQKWTPSQENLLAEWSEKATCFRWLHSRSEKSYRFKNYSFTIPVIILSTLTGTANFAMDSFVPEDYKQIAMACVGGVNIFAGIISTLQNFLRYAELMETHRMCEVQWSKFGRNIAVELALDPIRRKPADDFLKVCRAEYDRLIEQSPPIDDSIIKQFKKNFKNIEIKKPDICNGLDKCKIFVPSEEEKKAEAVASAGLKLLERKKSKQWNPAFKRELPKTMISNINSDIPIHNDSKRELDGLLNMNKVSQFKNKTNDISAKQDKDEHPMTTIHEMVKLNNNDDIEMGQIDNQNKIFKENKVNMKDITLDDDKEVKIDEVILDEDKDNKDDEDKDSKDDDDDDNQIKLKIEFLKGIEDIDKE